MDDIGIDIGLGGHHIGSDAITEGAYGYFSTSACDKGSDGEYQRDKCRAVTGVWEPGEMALFISSLAGRYEDALASVNNVIEGRIYFIAETPDGQLVASRPGSYNIVTEEYYLTPDDNDYSYVAPKALARDAVAELLAKDQQDVTVRFFVKVDAPAPAVVPSVQQDEVPEPRGDVSTGDVSDQAAGDGQPESADASGEPVSQGTTEHTGETVQHGDTLSGVEGVDSEDALQQGAEATVEEEQLRSTDGEHQEVAVGPSEKETSDSEEVHKQPANAVEGMGSIDASGVGGEPAREEGGRYGRGTLETESRSGDLESQVPETVPGADLPLAAEAEVLGDSGESHTDRSELGDTVVSPTDTDLRVQAERGSEVMGDLNSDPGREEGVNQHQNQVEDDREEQVTVPLVGGPESKVGRADEARDPSPGAIETLSSRVPSHMSGEDDSETGLNGDENSHLERSPQSALRAGTEDRVQDPNPKEPEEEDVFIGTFQGL